MNKTKANQLQHLLANELRSMARLLENENIVNDAGNLKRAADNCKLIHKNSKALWSYNLDQFQIGPIDLKSNKIKHSRSTTLKKITVFLNVDLIGVCLDDDAWENPFEELCVNIEVFGETHTDGRLTCAWHLDRQPDKDPNEEDDDYDEGDEKESKSFAHPVYHFHFGGKKVWGKPDAEFGTHLLLESPRLAHPPLDAILAIDFVLSNYLALDWRRLRRESSIYNDLVKTAQQRYWRPYAIAAARHWSDYPLPNDWGVNFVWPQIVL